MRDALIREEDSIVFSLIERARFPYNAPAYDSSFLGNGLSIAEFYVKESESLQAKVQFLSPFGYFALNCGFVDSNCRFMNNYIIRF